MADRAATPSLEDYFYQEAKEKCMEIEIKALKDFEKEKRKLVENQKVNVLEEFDKRLRQMEAGHKIAKSTRTNRARLEKMEARNQVLQKILIEAEAAIAKKISEDSSYYKELLKRLILQSIVKLLEPRVVIKCSERDVSLIEGLIPAIAEEYKNFIKKELGIEKAIDIVVDKFEFLDLRKLEQPTENVIHSHNDRISKTDETKKCFGGVLLSNAEQSITCKNTIDTRLELCYHESLPIIRSTLFPEHK